MRKFILLAMAFVFTSYFFYSIGESHEAYDPPTKTITKTVTKTKTRTVEKKVYIQAQPCKEAVASAQKVEEAAAKYENAVGRETAIQERSYHAITQPQKNKVAEDHRKVIDDTLDAALQMQEAHEELQGELKLCSKYETK